MTTFAPGRDDSAERARVEEGRRRAWRAYSDSLRDLAGAEYEEAERRSWERLQRDLEAAGAPLPPPDPGDRA